jgi:hypothetical protein
MSMIVKEIVFGKLPEGKACLFDGRNGKQYLAIKFNNPSVKNCEGKPLNAFEVSSRTLIEIPADENVIVVDY